MAADKKRRPRQKKEDNHMNAGYLRLIAFLLIPIVIAYVVYTYRFPSTNDVVKPFDGDFIGPSVSVDSRLWGSYRPQAYFGMKARLPSSPVFGAMWMPVTEDLRQSRLRHWCDHTDNIDFYSWTEHDGQSYGNHRVKDGHHEINASFVIANNTKEWSNRFSLDTTSKKKKKVTPLLSFFYYVSLEWDGILYLNDPKELSVDGRHGSLGDFTLKLKVHKNPENVVAQHYLASRVDSQAQLDNTVKHTLQVVELPPASSSSKHQRKYLSLGGHLLIDREQQKIYRMDRKEPINFVVFQIVAKGPVEIDVVYESVNVIRDFSLQGDHYTAAVADKHREFTARFSKSFGFEASTLSAGSMTAARNTFSNLVGGVGYFYGQSLVRSGGQVTASGGQQAVAQRYWPAELITAVPSRPFFPRGFLWDEGFHQLVIAHWDKSISKEIIASWLDLMNDYGWIPREQILGDEARAKVPEEFVVQVDSAANPPSLFLALEKILNHNDPEDDIFFAASYPRLKRWYNWFNTKQTGPLPTSYQWKGRNATTDRELNPKTLSSGLDDYPRASHPDHRERHLDLRCWMALAARVMSRVSHRIVDAFNAAAKPTDDPSSASSSKSSEKSKFQVPSVDEIDEFTRNAEQLADPELLDKLHWSQRKKRYADYGLHTDRVHLFRPKLHNQHGQPIQAEMRRKIDSAPVEQFVDSTFGYLSLFPLMMKLLPATSTKLPSIIEDIRNPNLLWTPYGLRSLAKNAPLYMKSNTEHDPAYWRGAIWINMNYLTVAALKHYAIQCTGDTKKSFESLYTDLRWAVIDNMLKQYESTGAVWEQYNDSTGKGQGTRPFTGWSSLLVSLMAEQY